MTFEHQLARMRLNMNHCMCQVGQRLIEALLDGLTDWSALRLLEIRARYTAASKYGLALGFFIAGAAILCK